MNVVNVVAPLNILTINAGSSSIKYKVFEWQGGENQLILSGLIEGIGESLGSWSHQFHLTDREKSKKQQIFANHQQAFDILAVLLKKELMCHPIQGVGHRVVHGGNLYFKPTRIDSEVLKNIQALSKLAPLHNPINAIGIECALKHFPDAVQLAIFDTGFHHSMPDFVSSYAIEKELAEREQIRRYGFHGINHEYVSIQAAKFLKKELQDCNFISLHLGNGASACLVKDGRSFDTSMGMTPLAGLIMGTRCGDIDPAIVIYLLRQGLAVDEVDALLNKRSGLKGMAQENDMRHLLARVEDGDKNAELALDMYVYAVQKIIGAYLSQISQLDALIFTGGIGENAAVVRQRIIDSLSHFGFELDEGVNAGSSKEACKVISRAGKRILVISGDEELSIAEKVADYILLGG